MLYDNQYEEIQGEKKRRKTWIWYKGITSQVALRKRILSINTSQDSGINNVNRQEKDMNRAISFFMVILNTYFILLK